MTSGKVTAIAFLLMFIVVCSDFSSVMVADAAKCCGENPMANCNDDACNTFCMESCGGGLCKVRGGKRGCHCKC
ncbi:hypothetical protein C5167_040197 [Papaver somniferum]|uniref:Knottin scorpion toxin-like domain-containing protein n=1 Tax=Papaver somniferum TaxID=3469 RepID=A0A4Y7IE97_PAPSO|nr:hypothetical protein C5167_040197 [Papaver somniferum]